MPLPDLHRTVFAFHPEGGLSDLVLRLADSSASGMLGDRQDTMLSSAKT